MRSTVWTGSGQIEMRDGEIHLIVRPWFLDGIIKDLHSSKNLTNSLKFIVLLKENFF